MRYVLDRGTFRLNRALQRVFPSLPVLEKWPGAGRFGTAMYWRLLRPAYEHVMSRLATLHRARLRGVVVIGVTGSTGKTTTKDLIGAVLSTKLRGRTARGSGNYLHDVTRNILATRSGDQFRVIEVGANTGPGSLDAPLALLRPDVGVVTNVQTDHYSAFGSVDKIAAEKRKMVDVLPATGTVVLNADDPRVLAMRDGFPGRVITFGTSPEASVRAENITAAWPDRLAFVLIHDGRRVAVQTQLCGAHWVSAALAAAAVGVALGVSLEAAADALGRVAPFKARMSPLALPGGVTIIRDDLKASVATIGAAFDFMREARASRKIVILGTISDHPGDNGVYTRVVRRALECADLVCGIGPGAFLGLRAKRQPDDGRVLAFSSVKAGAEYFRGYFRSGDLVLMTGSNTSDHLLRIVLAQSVGVACWQTACGKQAFCDTCALIGVPSQPEGGEIAAPGPAVRSRQHVDRPERQLIIGLGNPGAEFGNTPHNVGHAVVEHLAASLDLMWTREEGALLARGEWRGEHVCLVKLAAWMNHSGPALRALAEHLGVGPEGWTLIHDDLALPLGAVRARMNGSDGGHRGVRSILETFQTDQIRRVKVGVRRSGEERLALGGVLSPFTAEERTTIEKACREAGERVGSLLAEARRSAASASVAAGGLRKAR
jgi:UDP-N-acetylmuramoyl-tripeptide--D-alanyl-D-alanine ligase